MNKYEYIIIFFLDFFALVVLGLLCYAIPKICRRIEFPNLNLRKNIKALFKRKYKKMEKTYIFKDIRGNDESESYEKGVFKYHKGMDCYYLHFGERFVKCLKTKKIHLFQIGEFIYDEILNRSIINFGQFSNPSFTKIGNFHPPYFLRYGEAEFYDIETEIYYLNGEFLRSDKNDNCIIFSGGYKEKEGSKLTYGYLKYQDKYHTGMPVDVKIK